MSFLSAVFDAIMNLEVLCDHMNVFSSKSIDLAIPFDGLIPAKAIRFHVIIPSNVKHAQLHSVYI
jgi:hypothetical protein